MTEASWSEGGKTPAIDWSVSAALENVERGSMDGAGARRTGARALAAKASGPFSTGWKRR